MSVEPQRPHVDILPRNDTLFNIWAFTILRDDRHRVDTRCYSTYYVAESRNKHCCAGR